MTTGVITNQRGRISVSKTLKELTWLPVKRCIEYKVATLKLLASSKPAYFRQESCLRLGIDKRVFRHVLWSLADGSQLEVCSPCTKMGSLTFAELSLSTEMLCHVTSDAHQVYSSQQSYNTLFLPSFPLTLYKQSSSFMRPEVNYFEIFHLAEVHIYFSIKTIYS